MPRYAEHEPDEDDDWNESDEYDAYRDYDPEQPETYPEGLYDDDGPPLIKCPHCRAAIAEESEQCPRCRMYLTKEDAPLEPKSRLWMVLMVLALIASAFLMLG